MKGIKMFHKEINYGSVTCIILCKIRAMAMNSFVS